MVCLDTLRIKHLPKELSEAQKEDFVRHFGAVHVKVISSKAKEKAIVYAKFENADVAKNVLFRLHQLTVLNCRLSVEYAESDVLQGAPTGKRISELNDVPDKKFFRNFINSINAFNDSVGFHQPPPSHLKYNYPKANRSTINNIAHALATVPRFYTQVLHLMNKMNLPPPFAMPEPPVRVIQPSQHPVVAQKPPEIVPEKRRISSSESEIESDGESNKNNEIIPQKRTMSQKRALKRPKFIKQPVIQSSAASKPTEKPEDVFERVEVQQMKKIELRVMPELPPDPPKTEPVKQLTLQKNVEHKPTSQPEQKPTPQPEQKPTPQPEQKPNLQHKQKLSPQPERKPTPQPEQKPTQPKKKLTPQLEQKPTLQSKHKLTPQPAQNPTPQSKQKLSPQPEQKPTAQPEQKPIAQPGQKPTAQPEQKPTPQPEQKPTPQPEQKPTPQPEQEPTAQPENKPTPQPEKKTTHLHQIPTIPEQPEVIGEDREPNIVQPKMSNPNNEPEKIVAQNLSPPLSKSETSLSNDKSLPMEKKMFVQVNQEIHPKVVEKLDEPSITHINPIPEVEKSEKEKYHLDVTNQPTTTQVEVRVNISPKLNLENRSEQQEKLVPQLEVRPKPLEMLLPLPKVGPIQNEILDDHDSPDDDFPCISLEELAANQVTDLSVMPVFKNYNPGEPTNKLYIKNCAKTVAVQDLEYIYNRYREEGTEDKPSEFNIRLMKEGRMKGQAFVTLDSIEMAQKAVIETNGFILKDKPLVVVFGKAGKKKVQ